MLFKNHPEHCARSAGTSNKARIKINQKLLDWADVVFVMETKHKDLLTQQFVITRKQLIVLDIEDNYKFGDTELIVILKGSLSSYL
jgi:predicted protein tyrosine phosphatase